jgi:PPOX class probable F420-dependent enzyme
LATAPAWALALLRESRVARLGTSDAGGQPLVVPVCFAVAEAGAIYSAIDPKPKRTRDLRRLRNIRANPRVSLTVDHWDEDWRKLAWVIVEGRAEPLGPGPEAAAAVALLVAKYPQYRSLGLDAADAVVIRIAPARVLTWRFA